MATVGALVGLGAGLGDEELLEESPLLLTSFEAAFVVFEGLENIFIRNELPCIFLMDNSLMFLLLFAVPNGLHALVEQGFGLCEVPYGEFVLDTSLHVSDSEVKPLLVASRVGVGIHEQVVILVLGIGICEHLLDVAALKIGIDEQSLRFFLNATLLLLKILQILL